MKEYLECKKHGEWLKAKCPACIRDERDKQWIEAIRKRIFGIAGVAIVSPEDVIKSMVSSMEEAPTRK